MPVYHAIYHFFNLRIKIDGQIANQRELAVPYAQEFTFCLPLVLRNRELKMHVIFMVSSVLDLEEIMHCLLIIALYNLFAVEHNSLCKESLWN